MKALDGTTRAPWRMVVDRRMEHRAIEHGAVEYVAMAILECDHECEIPAEGPTRERYQCLECAKLPPAPKRTSPEKRARKKLMLTDDQWPVLVSIARGEWPWKGGAMGILVTGALVRLQKAGYVIHDPDTAGERGYATQYVATSLGHAAAVHADWEAWNESEEIWRYT